MKVRLTALLAPLTLVLGLVLPLAGSTPASAASGLSYHWPAPPIASAGSLAPGQSTTFILRVQNNGVPDPGGPAYLAYWQAAHVAGDSTTLPASQCGGVSLLPSDGSSVLCMADSKAQIALTYTAPAQPPAQGRADWTAKSSPTGQGPLDHYIYSTIYRFTSSPIAPSGSLAPGAGVPVTLTARDGLNNPVPKSTMYLSFSAAAGGGTAKVGSTPLTATPALFTAGTNGALQITYTAPSPLPSSGHDAIVVRDLHVATETNSDSYAFSASTPVVSVGDVTVVEGDQNPGTPAEFTVTVSPVQPNPITVQYRTLCGIGDKTCGEDFAQVTQPATVTIPANAASATVLVTQFAYVGAHAGETYNEGWFVELINPSVGVLGRSVGTGMLLPDVEGSTTPLPLLYTGSAGVVPVTGAAGVWLYFTVTLGAAEPTTVTFNYATADGTALGGVNYTPTSGTATIVAGKTSYVVTVLVLPNTPPTSNKTFTLTISNAKGGPTISGATGTGTILAG